MLKRPKAIEGGVLPAQDAVDGEFSSRYPTLWDYLSQAAWEDGKARQTSTLFIFLDDGKWTVMLKDRDRELVAFFKAERLTVCLTLIEDALCSDSVDWRADRKATRKSPKS